MSDPQPSKPEISYPCSWPFKVIGTSEDAVRAAVVECLDKCLPQGREDRPFTLGLSRTSGAGKYVSLGLELEVRDQAERDAIFQALSAHADIRLVI